MMRRPAAKPMTIVQLKRHMDRRFAIINGRLHATKDDVSALNGRMDHSFAEVLRRLDSLNDKMDSLFKSTNARMDRLIAATNDRLDQRFNELDSKIVERDRIFTAFERRIQDLEAGAGRR